MFLVPVEIGVKEFLQGCGIAPRRLNGVGIVSDRLVNIPGEIATIDVFADFATELVLVQKFTHGLLGTWPNHAMRERDCKERGGHGREQVLIFTLHLGHQVQHTNDV